MSVNRHRCGSISLALWFAADCAQLAPLLLAGKSALADLFYLTAFAWQGVCIARRPEPVAVSAGPRTMLLVAGSILCLPVGLALGSAPPAPSAFSTGLDLAAAALYLWAALTLGGCFALLPAAVALRSSGPYRLLPHPIYSAYVLGSVAILWERPDPLLAAVVVLEAVLLAARARLEEQLLAQTFPAYLSYREKVLLTRFGRYSTRALAGLGRLACPAKQRLAPPESPSYIRAPVSRLAPRPDAPVGE